MRNVIVTGGSRGIGLGIAGNLAANGYRVIAIARQPNAELEAAIHKAEASGHGSLQFVPADLSAIDNIPAMIKDLRKTFGAIYGLVNNAGISFDGPLALMPISQIEQLMRVNTLSPIIFTRCVIGSMMSDGGGRIINIASVAAFAGYSGLSVYSATKAALVGFTRSLAREVGRMGINVNSVAPGFVKTDMTQSVKEEQRQQIQRRSALRRLVDIEDIANAVEYLLSDKSNNITGTVLTVDAGNTA